jgi:hypothetical protein
MRTFESLRSASIQNRSGIPLKHPWMPADLAVATSFSIYSKSFPASCGIVKWCYSAASLVAAPFLAGRAELAIFTNDPQYVRSECGASSPRIVAYDEALLGAISRWSEFTNRTRPEPRKSGMPARAFSAKVGDSTMRHRRCCCRTI